MGLRNVLKRKFVITTDSNHAFPIAEHILNENFTSNILGEKRVSDITYIRVNDNWNYLITIIDLADRKVVGWTLSEDMNVENTVYQPWLVARKNRAISANHIFHSDRGVQYASNKIKTLHGQNINISQSMSRKGNHWDNAVAESFFKTIKYECINRNKYTSYRSLFNCITQYIDWYNTKRLHSGLGYLTPLEKEIKLREVNRIAA
jgi:putative transposase